VSRDQTSLYAKTDIIFPVHGAPVVAGATMPDQVQGSSGQINEHQANKNRRVGNCTNQDKNGYL
jgi:hypothetical protein